LLEQCGPLAAAPGTDAATNTTLRAIVFNGTCMTPPIQN
jgi:hypothetical protein